MTQKLQHVDIYCDGSAIPTKKQGSWVSLVRKNGAKGFTITGKERCGNSNAMEIKAVLEGIRQIGAPSKITVHTDATAVVSKITEYARAIHNNKKPHIKRDPIEAPLWEEMLQFMRKHRISAVHMPRLSTPDATLVHEKATQSR
jgi:ribonuclease HI